MPTIKLLKTKRDNVRTVRKGKYQDIYQDRRWKLLRAAKMRANPLCEVCEMKDRVTPTKEVHHKIPFDTGTTQEEIEYLAFNWNNLQSVCNPCHKDEHKKLRL